MIKDEKDLVEGLNRKDPAAFESLLSRYGNKLYRVASRITSSREDAEEVLQESLLSVFMKIETFNGRASLGTWLYRVVINAALTQRRSSGRRRENLQDDIGASSNGQAAMPQLAEIDSASPEDRLLRQEAIKRLEEGIARLPEPYRTVYVLAEIEGVSRPEIAEILDIEINNVKVRLHRARLLLRESLAGYFIGPLGAGTDR